jgi:L-amino acid N-acyltransferase YncA
LTGPSLAAVRRAISGEGETQMAEGSTPILGSYPREVTVADDRTVTLRLMEKTDRDRIVNFARALSPDDLLFLRRDITDPKVVDEWVREIERGRTVTVLAEKDGELLAYASLLLHETFWGRHMGEIRVLVRADYRGLGLGLQMASDVFAIAKDAGIEKVIARMTTEQKRTRARLERLGFEQEALLRGFALDREGKRRDLVIMSAGVGRLTDTEQIGLWRRP